MINVIGKNFQTGLVAEHVLDNLIAFNKIIAFQRSSEWVVVGRGTVREQYRPFSGNERRRIINGFDFSMK